MNQSYRVNEPDVTYETFEAEVLIINLRNGNYYSLRESAVPIWALLRQGIGLAEISRFLSSSCAADETLVAGTVRKLAEELVHEELVVALAQPAAATTGVPTTTLPTIFVPPVLDRYTDMQQLLLIDPIHEVDATGWPMKAPDQAPQ